MTRITVISRAVIAFYVGKEVVPARGSALINKVEFARWVEANADSELIRFLQWEGGLEGLFPEGHPMRGLEIEPAPHIGAHERTTKPIEDTIRIMSLR